MPATLVAVRHRDQRAEVGGRVVRVGPTHDLAISSATPATNSSYSERVHDGAGGGGAVLPGVDQRSGDRTVDGGVQVGVVEDHERRLAAQLEVHALDRVAAAAAITLRPTAVEPVNDTIVDVGMADQRRAGVRARCR